MKMSKAKALEIQARDVKYYGKLYPEIDVAGIVSRATTADQLAEGEHDVVEINRHIPRGGFLEMLIGKFYQTHG